MGTDIAFHLVILEGPMMEPAMRGHDDDETTVQLERTTIPPAARNVMVRLEPWVRNLLPRTRRLVPRGL